MTNDELRDAMRLLVRCLCYPTWNKEMPELELARDQARIMQGVIDLLNDRGRGACPMCADIKEEEEAPKPPAWGGARPEEEEKS